MRVAILGIIVAVAAAAAAQSGEVAAELRRGDDALRAGSSQEALKAFQKADKLAGGKCGECQLRMARMYAKYGDLQNAGRACDKVIANESPKQLTAEAHDILGAIAAARAANEPKRWAEAERQLRMAVAEQPEDPAYRLHLGTTLIRSGHEGEGVAVLTELAERFGESREAANARKYIAKPKLAKYDVAPRVVLETEGGEQFDVQNLGDKILVLDFWATWCGPCVESVPELKELTRKYPDRLVIVSVSADEDQQAWRTFIEKKKMTWPQILDQGAVRERFQVNSFPTYLVIDGDGMIRERIVGFDPQQSVAYRLRQVLKEMPELQAKK
jgi:thioredoxin-like negative regulator of GroEL